MNIRIDDLTHPEIIELLRQHVASAAQHSPPESIHALDLNKLRDPAITFWSAWSGSNLMGMCAMKQLDSSHGEIKSMRTAAPFLRQGVAARLLSHVVEEATRRGYERLSLETGTANAFAPARKLYEQAGFVPCPPFGQYTCDPYSAYMTMQLQVHAQGPN